MPQKHLIQKALKLYRTGYRTHRFPTRPSHILHTTWWVRLEVNPLGKNHPKLIEIPKELYILLRNLEKASHTTSLTTS